MVLAEEFRTEKYRILALDKVHIKGVISLSPDSFIFSYIEKCQINLRYQVFFLFFFFKLCGCMLSHVWLFAVACQAPLSIGFFRQEYWSRLSFLPLGDLPDPGIELMSLASPALAGRFFTTVSSGKTLSLSGSYLLMVNYLHVFVF